MKTRIYQIDRYDPDIEKLQIAAKAIRDGELVAFPTETVYGLGANALDPEAVRRIFLAKGRPSDNPLIAHVASVKEVAGIAVMNDLAKLLAERFWPGPLTLVLTAESIVPPEITAGLPTVAVRMPANKVARELITLSGVPIAGPSANRSGRPSPTNAASVYEDLGDSVSIILDTGPTEVGVESTVVDVTGDSVVILRPGGLPVEEIEKVAGTVQYPEGEKISRRSPGTRYRHYAPLIPLVLLRHDSDPNDLLGSYESSKIGYIGIREPSFDVGEKILFSDVTSYARGLFTSMRSLEKTQIEIIIAEFPDATGLGLALRDRLRRAAGEGSTKKIP